MSSFRGNNSSHDRHRGLRLGQYALRTCRVCARHLSPRRRGSSPIHSSLRRNVFSSIWPQWQQHGSGYISIFANALREFRVFSTELEERLVQAYRSHRPKSLPFYPGAESVLDELSDAGLKLGLLTDGQNEVQRSKLHALNPKDWFQAILCTGELGREYYKPHEAGFRRIVELLGAAFTSTAYVGDNPRTDFITPKKLGMTTVRVLSGEYASLPSPAGAVDHTCDDLTSASRWLLRHVHPCAS